MRKVLDEGGEIVPTSINFSRADFSIIDVPNEVKRITEKYNKPSAVFKIDKEKQQAVASLRWPEYFNVIEMIAKASPYLKRFWGHKGAWGLTIELQDLDKVIKIFEDHCEECICEENLEKVTMIDTVLFPHERNYEELSEIENLAPFWEGNNEPNFLFENIIVERVEKVWKNWWAHLKIFWKFWDEHLAIVFWWRWEESEKIKDKISLVWNVKRDTYNWWFYIHGVDWIE